MIKCVIFVALPAEARPLINHFGFRIEPQSVYRSYRSDALMLIETGLGKLNAASATGAVLNSLSLIQSNAPACLNVGLAGAGQPLGTLLAAHSVSDRASGKTWYPQPVWKLDCQTIALHTVDSPCSAYHTEHAFDMESAGMLASASRFNTLEFIQCLKIVSDNADHDFTAVDKSLAISLIEQHCAKIEDATKQLSTLTDLLPDQQPGRDILADLCQQFHFSATQKSHTYALLNQYQSRIGSLPELKTLQALRNTKALIAYLQSSINSAPRIY